MAARQVVTLGHVDVVSGQAIRADNLGDGFRLLGLGVQSIDRKARVVAALLESWSGVVLVVRIRRIAHDEIGREIVEGQGFVVTGLVKADECAVGLESDFDHRAGSVGAFRSVLDEDLAALTDAAQFVVAVLGALD